MFQNFLKKVIKRILFSCVDYKYADEILTILVHLRICLFRFSRYFSYGFYRNRFVFHLAEIGENSNQVFFGYYDISPFNHDETVLLASRTPLLNVPPHKDSYLEIGLYHLGTTPYNFVLIDRTNTWNWQQSCRLQWYPAGDVHHIGSYIIYNKLIDDHYGCCIQEVKTKSINRNYKRPIYSLTPDGRFGLSLNFSRLGRLRPGYGYTILPDETKGQRMPSDDGIWCIEMETGKDRLLFSIEEINQLEPLPTMPESEHYFNHICVNPDGSRFLFFHIWILEGKRYTRLITCNIDGSEPYALINEGHVSHYTWKSSNEILCYSTHADSGSGYHLYRDRTEERKLIAHKQLDEDGHPSYSPTQKFLLTDTYPDQYGDRNLLLYNFEEKSVEKLGSFYSPFKFRGEFRCDLHPRWSPSGKHIAFDSAHKGQRRIYVVDLA